MVGYTLVASPGILSVLFVLLLCLTNATESIAQDAYIKLESETTDVFVGDAIVIDIEYVGLPEEPVFDRMRQTTSFERETYGTRIAVVKGKVVEIKIRRMEFTAYEPGTYLFGPLEVDDVLSNSIAVKVLPSGNSTWDAADQDATITLSVTPERASIYQMQTLDITLRHTFPIAEEDIILPTFAGFETRSLVTARRTIGFNSLREINWKILLFPQTSGEHTINSVKWNGTLVKSRTERAEFERTSEPFSLSVLPAGSQESSADDNTNTLSWWLPASSVQLTEEWSKDVRELTAGEEVTRIIKLTASNVTSGQLPQPTVLESRAINQTLVNTERYEALTLDGINSSATFTYRVNAQSPIPVFLDTVRVPWWNTTINENDEAIIPARRINIGLPERADLLASLAKNDKKKSIQEQFSSLPLLALFQGSKQTTSFLLIICAILSAGIIYIGRKLLRSQKKTRVRSARKFLMLQLARENAWNSLYLMIDEQYKQIARPTVSRTSDTSRLSTTEQSVIQLKHAIGKLAFKKEMDDRDDTYNSSTSTKAIAIKNSKVQIIKIINSL